MPPMPLGIRAPVFGRWNELVSDLDGCLTFHTALSFYRYGTTIQTTLDYSLSFATGCFYDPRNTLVKVL